MRISSLAVLAFMIPAVAQESSWLTDFEAAKTAAKKDDKVILASFISSDSCENSAKLKNEVFSKPEFAEWAAKKVVLLELDFPKAAPQSDQLKKQNKDLAEKYRITGGYPKVLFLDAAAKAVGRVEYKDGGATEWIKLADAQLKLNPNGDDAGEGGWLTSYKDALAKAKKQKKVVLADFTGSDWCGWCIKLKDEVFSKPEFEEWAKEHVVLLELDFPKKTQLSDELKKQNEELRKEFGIEGFPTIVFIDSKGKKVGKSGYVEGGPAAWIAAAEKELGIKSKPKKKGK